MRTIDLNLLSVFVAVAELESFSAAASRLGLPRSSVSRAIASLEDQVGVRLLNRTTRHVSLSTAGEALLEQVAPSIASIQRAVGELPEREEEPRGLLRVTSAVDFGAAVLAEIVARFVARHPGVEIDLRLTNERVDLVAEGFDMAIRLSSGPRPDSSLVARTAGPLVTQLFAAPSYLARRGTPRTPADLSSHEWVRFRGFASPRLEGPGGTVAVEAKGRIACDDLFFAREVIRQGAGVGALPTFLAEQDVTDGRLVRLLPRWAMKVGHVSILYPASRHLPRKTRAFRDHVLDALKTRLPAVPPV